MNKINDWWNRYVPKREQPSKTMKGFVYRQQKKVKPDPDQWYIDHSHSMTKKKEEGV